MFSNTRWNTASDVQSSTAGKRVCRATACDSFHNCVIRFRGDEGCLSWQRVETVRNENHGNTTKRPIVSGRRCDRSQKYFYFLELIKVRFFSFPEKSSGLLRSFSLDRWIDEATGQSTSEILLTRKHQSLTQVHAPLFGLQHRFYTVYWLSR